MALSENQRKSLIDEINRCEKKILEIQAKAERDIAHEKKKIADANSKLAKG